VARSFVALFVGRQFSFLFFTKVVSGQLRLAIRKKKHDLRPRVSTRNVVRVQSHFWIENPRDAVQGQAGAGQLAIITVNTLFQDCMGLHF